MIQYFNDSTQSNYFQNPITTNYKSIIHSIELNTTHYNLIIKATNHKREAPGQGRGFSN